MAFTYVQQALVYPGMQATLTGVAAGSILVAFVGWADTLPPFDVEDNKNNFWNVTDCISQAYGHTTRACIAWAANVAAGDTTLTISGYLNDAGLSLHEYTGPSDIVSDGVASNSYTLSGNNLYDFSTGPVTTTVDNTLLLAMFGDEKSGIDYPFGGGFTKRTASNGHYHYAGDRFVTSQGTYEATCSTGHVTSSDSWVGTLLALRENTASIISSPFPCFFRV